MDQIENAAAGVDSAAAGMATPRRETTIALGSDRSGVDRQITALHFGDPGARPRAYIQTALHADELPGMLVVRRLVEALDQYAQAGEICGEIILVAVANPIGLSQIEGGYMQGRVERGTDRNFNRAFPDLAALVRPRLAGRLGGDAEHNVSMIREAMAAALAEFNPADAFEKLQTTLLRLACEADIVLDLHADNEALLHLYTDEAFWPAAADLAAEIDARAVLLSRASDERPFDEACSGPWLQLAEETPGAAIPPACFSATVELRSNNDVSGEFADRDARALVRFLMRRGLIRGAPGALPRLLGRAAPLRALQYLKSPIEGVVDYRLKLGDTVRKGDVVALVVPAMGDVAAVKAETDGLLLARHDQAWAWPGKTIAKVAGVDVLSDVDPISA